MRDQYFAEDRDWDVLLDSDDGGVGLGREKVIGKCSTKFRSERLGHDERILVGAAVCHCWVW